MKIKISIMISLAVAFTVNLTCNPSIPQGKYGWRMLTVPSNTSMIALGGTGASVSSEAGSFIIHPAAGLISRSYSITATQMNWHFDTRFNSIAVNIPGSSRSWGLALRSLDYGKFDARDVSGNIIGEFHPLDLNIIGNMAFRVSPNYYAGINIFLLYQKIDSASSLGLAADMGVTYLTPINGLNINAAVKHLGTTTTVKQERIKLPLTSEIGFGYRFPEALETVYLGVNGIIDPDDQFKVVIGSNVGITTALDLQLGYRINYDSHTYSAGVGFHLKNLLFNYAYLPFKYDINDAHSFSITYHFQ